MAAPEGEPAPVHRRGAAVAAATLVLLVVLALAVRASPVGGPGPGRPPNLVLLVWDTVRADRCGPYGAAAPTTPFLDSLAREGALFETALAPAPWTTPSHASLFTGLAPREHGLVAPRQALAPGHPPLLAQTLAAAGYETVGLSANANISKLTGLDAGFEHFSFFMEGRAPGERRARALEALRRWIDDRGARERAGERRPVLLFVNLMDAHLRYTPAPGSLAAVRPPGIDDDALRLAAEVHGPVAMAHSLGIRRLEPGTVAAMRVLYDACIHQADATTREILEQLRVAGHMEDAVVAVTSDHGESLGEHGQLDHGVNLYEQVLRIPLVVRAPGRIAPGTVVRYPVMLQDLYVELLDRAGVPVPPGCGRNARGLWTPPPPGRVFPAEYTAPLGILDSFAREWFPEAPAALLSPLRTSLGSSRTPHGHPRRWKYIRTEYLDALGASRPEREEIYDLEDDPGEERDLLAGPTLEGDEARLLDLLRRTAPDPCRPPILESRR